MFEHLTFTLAQEGEGQRPQIPAGDGGGAAAPEGPNGATQPADAPGGPNGQGQPGGEGLFGGQLMILILIFLVVMMGMTWFSQRKEKKRRQQMLDNLGKNDRVVTIGGVIGTVTDIKDNEVTLKVDESSNTRMKFSRNAIQGVVGEEGTGESR